MYLTISMLCVALVLIGAVSPARAQPTTAPADAPIRVMSFNIRNSSAPDGANAWPLRKAFCIDVMRASGSDLIGLQEVLADQADDVRVALPGYGFVGSGRDDGKRAGEFSPILFRLDRFELIAAGQSWLSETPDVVNSFGWDAACVRIMTWAKLRDRASGKSILVANTHWDHVGVKARLESAKLMRRLVDGLVKPTNEGGPPSGVIITGDFNCTEVDEPYRAVIGEGDVALVDAYRAIHPERAEDEASFHGFDGVTAGRRIDWILASTTFHALDARIDRTARDGSYPSDHYPVTATLTSGQ